MWNEKKLGRPAAQRCAHSTARVFPEVQFPGTVDWSARSNQCELHGSLRTRETLCRAGAVYCNFFGTGVKHRFLASRYHLPSRNFLLPTLVPTLRVGTHCSSGSTCSLRRGKEAEPPVQRVSRQSLETSSRSCLPSGNFPERVVPMQSFTPAERTCWSPRVDLLFADHLDLVDSTVVVENHKSYDAFGNVTAETNAAKDAVFAFTGKLFDDATG